jgi:hypothetical protein
LPAFAADGEPLHIGALVCRARGAAAGGDELLRVGVLVQLDQPKISAPDAGPMISGTWPITRWRAAAFRHGAARSALLAIASKGDQARA